MNQERTGWIPPPGSPCEIDAFYYLHFAIITTMFYRYRRLLVIALVLSAASFFVSAPKAAAEDGCVTGQCHATLLKAKNVHPIAESCDNCHQSLTKPHPQKGKKTFKLSQEPPELCFNCHTPFGKKPHVHPPVKDGMCTT